MTLFEVVLVRSGDLLRIAGTEILYSTALFAVVLLVARLLPRRYSQLRYLLWCLVLLRLVLPPDLSLQYSIGDLLGVLDALDAPPDLSNFCGCHGSAPRPRTNRDSLCTR